MADIWSKKKRSQVMSRIPCRGNKATELRLMAIFREFGIKSWRRNQKLLDKPDFAVKTEKILVFVNSCFWHGCSKCFRRQGSNQEYWNAKISGNRRIDRKVTYELRKIGWQVIRIWQHGLRSPARVAKLVTSALKAPIF